jgi:hypothetical protein
VLVKIAFCGISASPMCMSSRAAWRRRWRQKAGYLRLERVAKAVDEFLDKVGD